MHGMDDTYWGGRLSLEGSIHVLEGTVELHKQRADLASAQLAAALMKLDGVRRLIRGFGTVGPNPGPTGQFVNAILRIIDGES